MDQRRETSQPQPGRSRHAWRKVRLIWTRVEWPLVWAAAIAAFFLGYAGFKYHYAFAVPPVPKTRLDLIYETIQLYVLQSGVVGSPISWQFQLARFLAPALTIYTAAKALVSVFRGQLTFLRLWPYKGHVVICGLGRKGYLLARSFRRAGHRVVVIESDSQNDNIDAIREEGALVLEGDIALLLRKANAGSAKYVFVVLGDDSANARGAGHVRKLVADRKGEALTCLVHIRDLQLRDLLDERELLRKKTDLFRLEFFNVYQLGVRAMLRAQPLRIPEDGAAHLLIVGLGDTGQSLIAQAAGEWHAQWGSSRGRLRVTAIDPEAATRLRSLQLRHSQVSAVCEFIPLEIDIYSPEFRRADFISNSELTAPTAVYICLEQDSEAIYATLALQRWLAGRDIPVMLQTADEVGLASVLDDGKDLDLYGDGIYYFDLVELACDASLLPGGAIESVAFAIHADYIRQQRAAAQTPATNPSMAAWGELPEVLRESNRRQAEHIGEKLRAVGYEIEPLTDQRRGVEDFTGVEVDAMARMEHERWMNEHRETGWVYSSGPKSLERKTHPLLVPWSDLPADAKDYNRESVRTIPVLLSQVGLQAFRANQA